MVSEPGAWGASCEKSCETRPGLRTGRAVPPAAPLPAARPRADDSSGETKVITVPVAGTGGGGDEILLVNHSEQCLAPSKPSPSL